MTANNGRDLETRLRPSYPSVSDDAAGDWDTVTASALLSPHEGDPTAEGEASDELLPLGSLPPMFGDSTPESPPGFFEVWVLKNDWV
jgi:hypothetical protein